MHAEQILWSEEKQKSLQHVLVGFWDADSWLVGPPQKPAQQSRLSFPLLSSSLKIEVKYAVRYKFEEGRWRRDAAGYSKYTMWLRNICTWLNDVAPKCPSLMERSKEAWELSLRSWLIEKGRYKPTKEKSLSAKQTYVEYPKADGSIRLFRQIHRIIAQAYDNRVETDKDVWDLRSMGLTTNLSQTGYLLNFTRISQSWLRTLAKEFMKYNTAIHGYSDCSLKLRCLNQFSRFLAQYHPQAQAKDIDRRMIVEYISYVRALPWSPNWKNMLLIDLRVILETCSYQLNMSGLTKERIILDTDFAKERVVLPRDIPEEVLVQLRKHLSALDTTILRMVTILLECGLRINELCQLPQDCLIHDDKHQWYLRIYQSKLHQEHIIPLIDKTVVEVIQAQQEEVRRQWGNSCPYLFIRPSSRDKPLPFMQITFRARLNEWALKQNIRDRNDNLYHFQSHQFRHTVGMRLINEDVPLEVIRRLFGHRSLHMTEVYARMRATKVREVLERTALSRKTVNYRGQVVKGDERANDPDVQMVRNGIRGQTLPLGGCGRLILRGPCEHANKCLTCPFWLTSTDDLPGLKAFHARAIRLRQRAEQAGNQVVMHQQEHIIPNLALRITNLENAGMDGSLSIGDMLHQLHTDLTEAEIGLDEAREAGAMLAVKHLERTIIELKERIAALEEERA